MYLIRIHKTWAAHKLTCARAHTHTACLKRHFFPFSYIYVFVCVLVCFVCVCVCVLVVKSRVIKTQRKWKLGNIINVWMAGNLLKSKWGRILMCFMACMCVVYYPSLLCEPRHKYFEQILIYLRFGSPNNIPGMCVRSVYERHNFKATKSLLCILSTRMYVACPMIYVTYRPEWGGFLLCMRNIDMHLV